MGSTFYAMTILLTTSNFPDIMLPAMNTNPAFSLFFIIYLLLGLYFLLNVLLATIFSGYKSKMQEMAIQAADGRLNFLESFLTKHDKGTKGYLTWSETKLFLTDVVGFDYQTVHDRNCLRRFMRIVDP